MYEMLDYSYDVVKHGENEEDVKGHRRRKRRSRRTFKSQKSSVDSADDDERRSNSIICRSRSPTKKERGIRIIDHRTKFGRGEFDLRKKLLDSKCRYQSKSRSRSPRSQSSDDDFRSSHGYHRSHTLIRSKKPKYYYHFRSYDHRNRPQDDPFVTRVLFVGNLHHSITEKQLIERFSKFGRINHVYIKPPGKRQIPYVSYAFVNFDNPIDAYRAKTIMHRRFFVRYPLMVGYGKLRPTCRLWIGNIPEEVIESEETIRNRLEREFDRFGQIKEIHVFKKEQAAIIEYDTIVGAIEAREMMRGFVFSSNDSEEEEGQVTDKESEKGSTKGKFDQHRRSRSPPSSRSSSLSVCSREPDIGIGLITDFHWDERDFNYANVFDSDGIAPWRRHTTSIFDEDEDDDDNTSKDSDNSAENKSWLRSEFDQIESHSTCHETSHSRFSTTNRSKRSSFDTDNHSNYITVITENENFQIQSSYFYDDSNVWQSPPLTPKYDVEEGEVIEAFDKSVENIDNNYRESILPNCTSADILSVGVGVGEVLEPKTVEERNRKNLKQSLLRDPRSHAVVIKKEIESPSKTNNDVGKSAKTMTVTWCSDEDDADNELRRWWQEQELAKKRMKTINTSTCSVTPDKKSSKQRHPHQTVSTKKNFSHI